MKGVNNFFLEMQRFDIDISKGIVIYNTFRSAKLYAVYLQNIYLQFNTNLYSKLKSISDKEERVEYLKKLKAQLTEIDDMLLQTRDMFSFLQSLLADGSIRDYKSIIPKLEQMNVHIDMEGFSKVQLEEIDVLAFIDSQISFSYKAISLVYNMITLELGAPSAYGIDSEKPTYKLRWNGNMRQLTELFVELQRKGWIATIEDNSIEAAVENIVSLFDIKRTRFSEDGKEYKSMSEILKGALGKGGKRLYELLYTKDYRSVLMG